MRESPYYSVRAGINKIGVKLDLKTTNELFFNLFEKFRIDGYLQEYFGDYCVDAGHVNGKLGHNIESMMFLKLRKKILWPFNTSDPNYSEDDLFDIIEFIYDYISKPLSAGYHSYSCLDCGWHYDKFDQPAGRAEFRKEINYILKDYQSGYEISKDGEILNIIDPGFEDLLNADIPTKNPEIKQKMNHAKLKFRRYKSSLPDRRDAIRELADILELLRPEIKKVLTKEDDSDLFNLANNFGIRHYNQLQKDQYNKPIWYSWIFHFYLATIDVMLKFTEEETISL